MERKKRGRKPLNLTPEQRKRHTAQLQRMRYENLKKAEQYQSFRGIAELILRWHEQGLTTEEIAGNLTQDPKWAIKYNPNLTSLSGVEGGRIRRVNGSILGYMG